MSAYSVVKVTEAQDDPGSYDIYFRVFSKAANKKEERIIAVFNLMMAGIYQLMGTVGNELDDRESFEAFAEDIRRIWIKSVQISELPVPEENIRAFDANAIEYMMEL